MIREMLLSKSKYLNGLQCHKLLWYACHEPSAFPPVDSATQAVFDQGHQINRLAWNVFGGGILIDWDAGFRRGLEESRKALRSGKPVFEPGFIHNNLFARIDVLNSSAEGGRDLIEVKSSTQVKEEHLVDVAFQKYICDELGIKIRNCFLMLVDSTYIRRGKINPAGLLKSVNISRDVEMLQADVPERIKSMRSAVLQTKTPEVPIGMHCDSPRPCALKSLCWAEVPAHNVFRLKNGGKLPEELFKAGIVDLKNIPAGIELTRPQQIQIECEKTGAAHADPREIRAFLDQMTYPLYLLDFETISPAIPVYELCRPYTQIPFQYSLHIVDIPGGPSRHFGYLHAGRDDPRPEILNRLRKEIGPAGSIVAYNAKFEIKVLNEATEFYPEYRGWFEDILPRFVDLYQPFRFFQYYHPSQNGSASLKVVMPALIGTSYEGLEIGVGAMASQEFYRITFSDVDPKECAKIRKALDIYCKQDTEGMIRMLEAMARLVA